MTAAAAFAAAAAAAVAKDEVLARVVSAGRFRRPSLFGAVCGFGLLLVGARVGIGGGDC